MTRSLSTVQAVLLTVIGLTTTSVKADDSGNAVTTTTAQSSMPVVTITSAVGDPQTVTWSAVQTATKTKIDGKETEIPAPFWLCVGGACGVCAIPAVCGGVAGGGAGAGAGIGISPPTYDPPVEENPPDDPNTPTDQPTTKDQPTKTSSTKTSSTTCGPINSCIERIIVSQPTDATTWESSTTTSCKPITTAICGATGATSFITSTITPTCNGGNPLTKLPEATGTWESWGVYHDGDEELPQIPFTPPTPTVTGSPYCVPYQAPAEGKSYCTCSDHRSYSFDDDNKCPHTKPPTSAAIPEWTPPPAVTDDSGFVYYKTDLQEGIVYGCKSTKIDRQFVGMPITKCIDSTSVSMAFTPTHKPTTTTSTEVTCPTRTVIKKWGPDVWYELPSCWDCPKGDPLAKHGDSYSCGKPCKGTYCKFN